MKQSRNVIIIGSGPAGLTAAIYASRANLSPLIFEGEINSSWSQPGGQLMLTGSVENFPGFPDGVEGPELMAKMREQAVKFGAEIISKNVERVDFSGAPYRVWANNEEYSGKTIILSTGSKPRMLGLESENKFIGKGVSTCATCDGFFFKDKDIAVIGGGDSALEEAIFLSKLGKNIYVVHRRDTLKASKIMQSRASKNEKIKFVFDSEVTEVLGDDRVSGLELLNKRTGEKTRLEVEGVFIAIGHIPNTEIFKGELKLDEHGYVITDGTKTSKEGIFACGDAQDRIYKQAITSAGSGCAAALSAERWLALDTEI